MYLLYRFWLVDFPRVVFPLLLFRFLLYPLIFSFLIAMCLSMDLFGVSCIGFCSSWTWMIVSFPQRGKFWLLSSVQSAPVMSTLWSHKNCMPGFLICPTLRAYSNSSLVSVISSTTLPLHPPLHSAFDIFPESGHSSESAFHQVTKYWTFNFVSGASTEYFRTLPSSRIPDLLDLYSPRDSLKSESSQHQSSNHQFFGT